MIKRPLVQIDSSHDSLRALAHALGDLRGSAETGLHVLNVQMPPIDPGDKLVSPDILDAKFERAIDASAMLQAQIGARTPAKTRP